LILISVFFVHPPVGEAWAPQDVNSPVTSLLWALFTYLAIPCVLLSTVSTIMQNWFAIAKLGNPYSLYSISNIGSMGALILYPLAIEPYSTVSGTLQAWTVGYWVLVALAALSTGVMIRYVKAGGETSQPDEPLESIPKSRLAVWVALSATGSVLLLTFTNHLTHDIAPVPFLWVIPLCLYLLTFILCFSGKPLYHSATYIYLSQAVVLAAFIHARVGNFNPGVDIGLNLLSLFLFCMICHGELYRMRPQPRQLSLFYLMLAVGGALGGILVNLVAPVIFNNFYEFNLMIMGIMLFSLILIRKYDLRLFYYRWLDRVYAGLILGVVIVFGYAMVKAKPDLIFSQRNFYGAVTLGFSSQHDTLILMNGTTVHGGQLIDTKTKRMIYTPTTYYVEESGFGITQQLLREHRGNGPLEIAAIGLGAGTIATYGQKGDHITFFEIDPKIITIAQDDFRFIKDSDARVDVVLGDARLSLNKQPAEHKYDLILVDAFSGDSIPIHLLTREAMEIYLSHLKPDGALLFHVSNRYLALPMPIVNLARHFKLNYRVMHSEPNSNKGLISDYIALSPADWLNRGIDRPEFAKQYGNVKLVDVPASARVGLWRDDYSNLLSIFLVDWLP
jgi:SAM-dependent methyltransferase